MCASSKPAWTIFFECDIADRRSTRSSGTGAMATADSKTPGSGRPVRALNSRFEPASERPTSPRFSIGAQGNRASGRTRSALALSATVEPLTSGRNCSVATTGVRSRPEVAGNVPSL